MSEEELAKLAKEWQEILRMQDWNVNVKISRGFDMPLTDSQAVSTWRLEKRIVTIDIIDPVDYNPSLLYPQDMEQSLVHELLHPLMAMFESEETAKNGSMSSIVQEQIINSLASAFVNLKRRGMPCKDKGVIKVSDMDLEEAIRHAKDVANSAECSECRAQHEQLVSYLQELKFYRENRETLKPSKDKSTG